MLKCLRIVLDKALAGIVVSGSAFRLLDKDIHDESR